MELLEVRALLAVGGGLLERTQVQRDRHHHLAGLVVELTRDAARVRPPARGSPGGILRRSHVRVRARPQAPTMLRAARSLTNASVSWLATAWMHRLCPDLAGGLAGGREHADEVATDPKLDRLDRHLDEVAQKMDRTASPEAAQRRPSAAIIGGIPWAARITTWPSSRRATHAPAAPVRAATCPTTAARVVSRA